MSESSPDPVLTVQEVARDLRISKTQAHRLLNGEVKGGTPIPHIRVGRRQLVTRSSLEAWKRAETRTAEAPDTKEA